MGTNSYHPDGWCIIKMPKENDFRVFASWGGGYVHGDSWRVNSGIASYKFDEMSGEIDFIGDSGSVYTCNIMGEDRLTAYTRSVLLNLIKTAIDTGKEVSVIPFAEFQEQFKQSS